MNHISYGYGKVPEHLTQKQRFLYLYGKKGPDARWVPSCEPAAFWPLAYPPAPLSHGANRRMLTPGIRQRRGGGEVRQTVTTQIIPSGLPFDAVPQTTRCGCTWQRTFSQASTRHTRNTKATVFWAGLDEEDGEPPSISDHHVGEQNTHIHTARFSTKQTPAPLGLPVLAQRTPSTTV